MRLKTNWAMLLAMVWFGSFLISCSKDDNDQADGANTFVLDYTRYSINIASLKIQDDDSGMSNAVVILTGGSGSTIGTISFIASFPTASGINGTYSAANGGSVGTPWTYASHLGTYSIQDGSDIQLGGYATGPLKITSHGSNEYSVEFIVTYADDVEASATIRRSFTNP